MMNKDLKKKLIKTSFLMVFSLISLCACSTSDSKNQTKEKEEVRQEATEEKTEKTTERTEVVTTEASTEELFLTINEVKSMNAGEILTKEDLENLDIQECFYSNKIDDETFSRMDGISYGEGCIMAREDLRYLRVLHMGFDGETHIGELVCNKALAEDFLDIFEELYASAYPIEKMYLVDEYGGDDELSMEDNNTSCFNYRPVPGSDHLSQHAYGRAIDVNPLYNPYITSEGYTPYNAGDYVDRNKEIPHKIDYDDLCYEVFDQHGFLWGGTWNSVKDYQHFQKKE